MIGGSGGATTTVTSLDALTSAVAGDAKKIVIISGTSMFISFSSQYSSINSYAHDSSRLFAGTITGDDVVRVGSNTTVLGESGACQYHFAFHASLVKPAYLISSPVLQGVGLRVLEESNVIIRNIAISKV